MIEYFGAMALLNQLRAGKILWLTQVSTSQCFVCFSLRDCTMGPEDVTRLCQILVHCTQLTEIE